MAIVKVIEVLAESEKSWEDAARRAVTLAAETIDDIQSIYIKYFEAKVEDDKITRFRINAKISFLLADRGDEDEEEEEEDEEDEEDEEEE